jgi:RNA polymerase sigma-70 factor, ECF subfamily
MPDCPSSASDYEKFTRLFLAHEPEIFQAVLAFVPNRQDARDIVQECAVTLWKHFHLYNAARPFVHWAIGYSRMEVRRFLRACHRRSCLTEQATEALMQTADERAGEMQQREAALQQCLELVPGKQRQIIEGYYFLEQTAEQLAAFHGRTTDAIYKVLQRTRRNLLDCIQANLTQSTAR